MRCARAGRSRDTKGNAVDATESIETDLVADEPRAGRSLTDLAYLRLREEIISAELMPGTLLREAELRSRLGMGRTPIREALQLLQHTGLVVVLPRRGTLVSEVNVTDITTIFEVRVQMESWAARLATERADEDDLREAARLIDKLRSPSGEELLDLDRSVHRLMYRCTKNGQLMGTLEHYQNLSLRILHVVMKRHPTLMPALGQAVADQEGVLEALCRRDADDAERRVREHVLAFERRLRTLV